MKKVFSLLSFLCLLFATPSWGASTSNCFDADTKAMLHGNGTEGSTTFTDSSKTPHTFTANGDVKINTAKFESNSGFFDGSGDYLTAPDSNDWTMGTSYTVDMWFRISSFATTSSFFGHTNGAVDTNNFYALFTDSGTDNIVFRHRTGGVTTIDITWTTTLATNTWYHLAFVKDGDDYELFIDGVSQGTQTDNSTQSNFAGVFGVGGADIFTPLIGWLDEVRVSQDVVRWTSNFTPSTTEYSSDSNTKLLLHMNGAINNTTFTDSGNTGHTITTVGGALQSGITRFQSGSMLFDGAGDYITSADSDDWTLNTDFTIETWVRFSDVLPSSTLIQHGDSTSDRYIWLWIGNPTNTLTWQVAVAASLIVSCNFAWSPSNNVWYHVVLSHSGSDHKAFVDGTQVGSTCTDADVPANYTTNIQIGARTIAGTPAVFHNGWLDEYRIVNGKAIWTSNFTTPNAAYYKCQKGSGEVGVSGTLNCY